MAIQKFFLCGDGVSTAVELDISAVQNIDELKRSISAHYGIVQPEGVAFQADESELSDFHEVTESKTPVGITVDGHSVRDVPGPQGLPWVGNYFEGIYVTPQRLSDGNLYNDRSVSRSSWEQPAALRQVWAYIPLYKHGQDRLPNQRSCDWSNCIHGK
jgi:hypothetical protein